MNNIKRFIFKIKIKYMLFKLKFKKDTKSNDEQEAFIYEQDD